MLDMWQPELGRVHTRFRLALQWCGALFLASFFLPLRIDWDQTLWSWTVLDRWSAVPGVCAPLVVGLALIALGRWARWSSLITALAGAVLVAMGSWCIAANPDTGEALLYGLPPQMRTRGWLLALALIAAGAASKWIGGPRQGERVRKVLWALVLLSWAATLVLLCVPSRGGFLIVSFIESAAEIAQSHSWHISRSSLAVNLVLSVMPVLVGIVVSLLALRWSVSRAAWVVGVPAVVTLLWAMKIATLGGDAVFGFGLRSAMLFAAQIVFGLFATEAALSQLLDLHVPESLARAGLLRDALLAQALRERKEPAKTVEGYRPLIARLVQERYESLALVNVRRGESDEGLNLRVLLRLGGWLQEDMAKLSLDQVKDARTRVRPPSPKRWANALAQGRRIEGAVAGIALAAVVGTLAVQWLTVPRAPEWKMQPAPAWATELYEHLLPRIGIAAGRVDEPDQKEVLAKAIDEAVRTAAPVPKLADAIRDLGTLAADPGPNRRAIVLAGERLNEAARTAQLPLYADPNVRGYIDAEGHPSHVFYVKTYDIRQARSASVGRASYEVLRLERLDETNVEEQRLGWRKLGAPYAMVILDVVHEYWATRLMRLIRDGAEDPSYGRPDVLRDELTEALVAEGLSRHEALRILQEGLSCNASAELKDVVTAEQGSCREATDRLRARAVAALARMVEGHELQHQIDGESLRPPTALWQEMSGYDDGSVLRATNELSAYLAEIIRAPRPKMALAHFDAVANAARGTPEAFAGNVALPMLTRGRSVPEVMQSVDSEEVRRRARAAYVALFGAEVPTVVY